MSIEVIFPVFLRNTYLVKDLLGNEDIGKVFYLLEIRDLEVQPKKTLKFSSTLNLEHNGTLCSMMDCVAFDGSSMLARETEQQKISLELLTIRVSADLYCLTIAALKPILFPLSSIISGRIAGFGGQREQNLVEDEVQNEKSISIESEWEEDEFCDELMNHFEDQNVPVGWDGKVTHKSHKRDCSRSFSAPHFSISCNKLNIGLYTSCGSTGPIARIESSSLDLMAQRGVGNASLAKYTIRIGVSILLLAGVSLYQDIRLRDCVAQSHFEYLCQPLEASETVDMVHLEIFVRNRSRFPTTYNDHSSSQEFFILSQGTTESGDGLGQYPWIPEIEVEAKIAPLWFTFDFETLFLLQMFSESFGRISLASLSDMLCTSVSTIDGTPTATTAAGQQTFMPTWSSVVADNYIDKQDSVIVTPSPNQSPPLMIR